MSYPARAEGLVNRVSSMFTEIQTVTVTSNELDSLDSFIESVTIYSFGEGPCNDTMEYMTITVLKSDSLFLTAFQPV